MPAQPDQRSPSHPPRRLWRGLRGAPWLIGLNPRVLVAVCRGAICCSPKRGAFGVLGAFRFDDLCEDLTEFVSVVDSEFRVGGGEVIVRLRAPSLLLRAAVGSLT